MAGKILLVDDDPDLAGLGAAILASRGFEVEVRASAEAALRAMSAQQFALLATDLNIGGRGDGFVLAGAFKALQPQAAVLLVTGSPDFEAAWQAIQFAVDRVLLKPLDPQQLIEAVEQLRAGGRVRRGSMSLAELVEHRLHETLEQWLAWVEHDELVAEVRLDRRGRIDDLAEMLAAVAERIRQPGRAMGEQRWEAAVRHGRLRREQGYRAQGLLREASILREVITASAMQNFLQLDPSRFLADLVEMNAAIDEAMAVSLEAFMGGVGG